MRNVCETTQQLDNQTLSISTFVVTSKSGASKLSAVSYHNILNDQALAEYQYFQYATDLFIPEVYISSIPSLGQSGYSSALSVQ